MPINIDEMEKLINKMITDIKQNYNRYTDANKIKLLNTLLQNLIKYTEMIQAAQSAERIADSMGRLTSILDRLYNEERSNGSNND